MTHRAEHPSTSQAPDSTAIKVAAVCVLQEKVTAVDADKTLFGGFCGGVYAVETGPVGPSPVPVTSHPSPVSFLRRDQHLLLGDWDGFCLLGESKVAVSSLPIKYIHPGADYFLVSDSMSLLLVVDGAVVSTLRLGTYVLSVREEGGLLRCLTGYTMHWVSVAHGALQLVATANLQEKTGTNETFTCLVEDGSRCFAGSVGGWIIELSEYSTPGSCTVRKLARVAEQKVTDLLLYRHGSELWFACTTPNSLYLISRTGKLSGVAPPPALSLALTGCNGLCSVWQLSPGVLAVLNVNHKLYTVHLTGHLPTGKDSSSDDSDRELNTEEIYNELFQSISVGEI